MDEIKSVPLSLMHSDITCFFINEKSFQKIGWGQDRWLRPRSELLGKTSDAQPALLLEWKKSTQNLNKLFYNLFLFSEHELNILVCVPPCTNIMPIFSFAICYYIKVLYFFFHFINQIIDGYMSIIQLTAFLFIGWKHTTHEKKTIPIRHS